MALFLGASENADERDKAITEFEEAYNTEKKHIQQLEDRCKKIAIIAGFVLLLLVILLGVVLKNTSDITLILMLIICGILGLSIWRKHVHGNEFYAWCCFKEDFLTWKKLE